MPSGLALRFQDTTLHDSGSFFELAHSVQRTQTEAKMNTMTKPFIFYGVDLSLYSGKLRSYLRFKNIPDVERPPSFVTFNLHDQAQNRGCGGPCWFLLKVSGCRTPAKIIEVLEQRFPDAPALPSSPVQNFAARPFELWGDEFSCPRPCTCGVVTPRKLPLVREGRLRQLFSGLGRAGSAEPSSNTGWREVSWLLPVLGVTPQSASLLDK